MDNLLIRGEWPAKRKAILLQGIDAVALALGNLLYMPPGAAYMTTFGAVKLVFSWSQQAYGGKTETYEDTTGKLATMITFGPKFSEKNKGKQIAIHELGHAFALLYRPGPMEYLSRGCIVTESGLFVTGTKNGLYHRHGGRCAPDNGYRSDKMMDGYQMHPMYLDEWSNCPDEDWPDMWLNWVMGTFVENEAGVTLNNWVDSHLREWLKGGINA